VKSVRVNGVGLHVETFGETGPAVVIAHGLMGSVALARRFGEDPAALAARGLRVVAYDARGHGRSEGTADEISYRWSQHARDLAGLVEALELAPASLYGGSMGAGSSLLVALERPELVDRLVLRAPPPFGRDLGVARRTFLPLATAYAWLGAARTARLVTALPNVRRMQRETPQNDLRTFFSAQHAETVVPAIRGLLRERDPIPVSRFAEIGNQTLVLAHPSDPIHPLASADQLLSRLPKARLVTAPSPGYFAAHPEALTDLVADFLLSRR
jgi:pimeloyl-ACP methyl ester carboxylesterase